MIAIRVIRSEEQKTSEWSGGVTTQLAIWPEGADYATRNFDWRISTARVELEESNFTALPGISRWLMLLEGRIHLAHDGIGELDMVPFENVARFDGGWKTKSVGKCVDFNLMMKDGFTGGLGYVPAGAESVTIFEECGRRMWEAFYCLVPKLELTVEDERIVLKRNDFLLLSADNAHKPTRIIILNTYNTIYATRATVIMTD